MAANNDSIDPSKPLVTEGYVCNEAGAPFKLQPVTLPPLSSTGVQVTLSMTGLCHTDIHMRDNDWGTSDYPFLGGHEGVGTITHIGSSVRSLAVGDRVGIAWIRDSCRTCRYCLEGRDNICRAGYQGTYLGQSAGIWGRGSKFNEHGGCFARVQRIEERFAVRIPDCIADHVAAPLLCGGATVYEPLANHAQVGDRVGVVGIGGLGRAALKLAKLRGCRVVAISSSPDKRAAALEAGADEFWVVGAEAPPPSVDKVLDVIVDTRPVNAPLGTMLALLGSNGTYARVGIPSKDDQDFTAPWIPAVFQQHAVTGSAVTGSKRINEMMGMCADNIDFIMKGEEEFSAEVIDIVGVNEAMDRLSKRENKGYRYVLKW